MVGPSEHRTLFPSLRGVVRGFFLCAVLTISFDIFLVIPAGFNIRFPQILLSVPILFIVSRTLLTGRIPRPVGISFLLAWTGFILAFVPHSGLVLRSVGYGFWLLFSILMVMAAVALFNTEEGAYTLLRWYLFSFAAVAGFGLAQFFLPLVGVPPPLVVQWWIPGTLARINGFSYEPSYFATYLLPGWTFTAYLLEKGNDRLAGRWTLVGAFLVITLAMILSSSRMGWIMMALWCLQYPLRFTARALLAMFDWRLFRTSCAMLAILLVVGAAVIRTGAGKIELFLEGTGILGTSSHSASARLGELSDTLSAFQNSPVVGYSLGGVASAVGEVRDVHVAGLADAKWNEGMNVFAEVLAASGAIGFIPFLLYIASLFFLPLRLAGTFPGKNIPVFLRGLTWSFLFVILILQFNQNILRPYLWLHIGILSAIYNVAARSREKAPA